MSVGGCIAVKASCVKSWDWGIGGCRMEVCVMEICGGSRDV